MLPSPSACPNGTEHSAPRGKRTCSRDRHGPSGNAEIKTTAGRRPRAIEKQETGGGERNTLLSFSLSRVHADSPSTTYHLFLECVGDLCGPDDREDINKNRSDKGISSDEAAEDSLHCNAMLP